jgi:hypothetical protein
MRAAIKFRIDKIIFMIIRRIYIDEGMINRELFNFKEIDIIILDSLYLYVHSIIFIFIFFYRYAHSTIFIL